VKQDSVVLRALDDTIRVGVAAADRFGNPASEAPLTWTSLTPAIATVDGEGVIRARSNGRARVVASTAGASDTVHVRVRQRAATLELSAARDTLLLGDTLRLSARVLDANGHPIPDASVAWSSSDSATLRVDSGGVATALRGGVARVVATVEGARAELSVRARLPKLLLEAASITLREAGEVATVNGRVRGLAIAEPQVRVVEESRWLGEVPVLDPGALAAGRLRALGAGQARIEISAAGAEPDTLTLRVAPRRPRVERLVLPPEGSDGPLVLRGFGMERVAPGAVRAGDRAVTVVARDSANVYFRISDLPNAACGTNAPLSITVAGAEAPVLSYERSAIAPVLLRVGEALALTPQQMACLRLPGHSGARYALAALDVRPLRPGGDGVSGPPTLLVRDWTGAAGARPPVVRTSTRTPATAPDHVSAAGAAAWGQQAEPWQVGDAVGAAGGEESYRVARVYGGRFVLALPEAAVAGAASPASQAVLARVDTAMAVLLTNGVPLLERTLGPAAPVTSPRAGQLLILATRLGAAAQTQTFSPAAERAAPTRPRPASVVLLDADTLAASNAEQLLAHLAHQVTHAWQAAYLYESGAVPRTTDLFGAAWAREPTASLLASEVLRRQAGVPAREAADWSAGFLGSLVEQRGGAGESPEDALREVVRGALVGWYGSERAGDAREGLLPRMRGRLGGGWEPARALLAWTLQQAVFYAFPPTARPSDAAWRPALRDWKPLESFRSGDGRSVEATTLPGEPAYFLIDDDGGGSYHLGADVGDVVWMLARLN
jgi:hypothetical protein